MKKPADPVGFITAAQVTANHGALPGFHDNALTGHAIAPDMASERDPQPGFFGDFAQQRFSRRLARRAPAAGQIPGIAIRAVAKQHPRCAIEHDRKSRIESRLHAGR
nr:hypothetical protein [Salinisphaera sp.]